MTSPGCLCYSCTTNTELTCDILNPQPNKITQSWAGLAFIHTLWSVYHRRIHCPRSHCMCETVWNGNLEDWSTCFSLTTRLIQRLYLRALGLSQEDLSSVLFHQPSTMLFTSSRVLKWCKIMKEYLGHSRGLELLLD